MQSKERMDKTKAGKITSLIISIIICSLTLQNTLDWSLVGIFLGCEPTSRLLYPFYHANILHATLNAWCLLSVVFIYDITIWRLLLMYIIATLIPDFCLSTVPTVGLSGVIFALFGSISFNVERKLHYQLWMLAYLVAGFLLPNTNALLHLYCYIGGVAVAILNKPIKIG